MDIKVGQFAKDFSAVDLNGNTIRLSDFKGRKIILGFYRNVNCPFCNRRVHQLMMLKQKLKNAGVQMLMLFESSNEKISSSSFHRGISEWPVIGDHEKLIYKLYGVENSMMKMANTFLHSNPLKAKREVAHLNLPEDKEASGTLIPADFFIDENFKVVMAKYGNHLDDHVDMDILKSFAGIQSVFAKS
ncbi:peroxiredoxin family protein [Saccharicrinis fermentans]|uniref:Putative peroxiredoxin/MT2597 n=1 Tax=Saccharicrinis fermentans DSM 9555 = JCM 21142 TaxID=869213 RepID=W7YCK3_9BACT|nr:redoxin domain-containing protein [Saccharicrinis fermentans]GAF05198.1 putative peroxiredoxin/MT2597 [Saccharicrinis fermentans DSM 9555 = JCM 21142]